MATLKQRLHRKNASGAFDAVHLETSSDLVLRPSGNTVEQDLTIFQTNLDGLKTSVSEGKALVAAAVTDKGVSTAADATFQTIAENIAAITVESSVYFSEFTTPTYPTGSGSISGLQLDCKNFVIAIGKLSDGALVNGSLANANTNAMAIVWIDSYDYVFTLGLNSNNYMAAYRYRKTDMSGFELSVNGTFKYVIVRDFCAGLANNQNYTLIYW